MQYLERLRNRSSLVLGLMFALLLVAAVACGTAAEQQAPAAPAAEQPAAASSGAAMQPTAMPAPADPAMAMDSEIADTQVIMMLGGFGAEVFDNTVGGLAKEPRKHIHGNLTTWDLIDGQMEIVDGIASKWEMSEDLKTLTYTIMEGA